MKRKENEMGLSENIRSYRLKKRFTQEQLANRLGVSPQAVSRWETSDTMPDTALLPDLARTLETSIDALFGYVSSDRTSLYDAIERFVTAADSEAEKIKRVYELIVAGNKCVRGEWDTLAPDYSEYRNTLTEKKTPEQIASMGQVSTLLPDAAVMTFESTFFPYAAVIAPSSESFASILNKTDALRALFHALGDRDAFLCLMHLLHKQPTEITVTALIQQSGANGNRTEEIAELLKNAGLSMLRIREIDIDGKKQQIISYSPQTPDFPMLLFAAFACILSKYGFRSTFNETDGPLL